MIEKSKAKDLKTTIPTDRWLVIGLIGLIVAPLNWGVRLFLALIFCAIAFAYRQNRPSKPEETPILYQGFAKPTTSQVNPFVASTEEMRVAILHDIQTPLSKIIAHVDTLSEDSRCSQSELGQIRDSASYLSQYTARYFEYFGLQETTLRIDRRLDLAELLRTILIEYVDIFEERGISYRFDIPDKPIFVHTEAYLLDRALSDLFQYLMAPINAFNDIRVTVIIRKKFIETNVFIDTDQQTRDALSTWRLFGHTDTSRNAVYGRQHLAIVLANQMILKHQGALTVSQYASSTLHYQIKLQNPTTLYASIESYRHLTQ